MLWVKRGFTFNQKLEIFHGKGELVGDLDAVGNDIIETQFKKWGRQGIVKLPESLVGSMSKTW